MPDSMWRSVTFESGEREATLPDDEMLFTRYQEAEARTASVGKKKLSADQVRQVRARFT